MWLAGGQETHWGYATHKEHRWTQLSGSEEIFGEGKYLNRFQHHKEKAELQKKNVTAVSFWHTKELATLMSCAKLRKS